VYTHEQFGGLFASQLKPTEVSNQTWGKYLAQMLEALLQALEKCLSTSTSTNASIK